MTTPLNGDLTVPQVRVIEQLALGAWPGLEREDCGGWQLRCASGITRRANSVWPNEARDGLDVQDAIEYVERFYHGRNLPARFQICQAAQPRYLDEVLTGRGYRAVARTAVQTAPVHVLATALGSPRELHVEIAETPSLHWWQCYAAADEVPPASVQVRQEICAAIQPAVAYATVIVDGEAIAVASAVYEAGWVGFFNVATLHAQRRKGAARAMMAELCNWGRGLGADNAYLQVMANNEAALRLYNGLGFTTGYYYHYREETIL